MKKYSTIEELRRDWLLSSHLMKALKANGFGNTLVTIINWERSGVLPAPKRIQFQGKKWRVYTKEDIDRIIDSLIKRSEIKPIVRK